MSAILWGYQLIQQKIVDLLNANVDLKDSQATGGPGTEGIRLWYYEAPATFAGLGFPFGFIEFLSSPIGSSTVSKYLHKIRFRLGIAHRAGSPKDAMKKCQDVIERIQKVLNADKTLGALVDDFQWFGDVNVVEGREADKTIFILAIVLEAYKEGLS